MILDRRSSRFVSAVASGALVLTLAACGGGAGASSQVASLGATGDATTNSTDTNSTVAADTQQAWIDFAQCMRDNGVDMKDPTFDASGNLQGGFGPDSGIDFRSDATRTAMTACGSKMPAGGPGGAGGPQFDRTAIQAALTSFTSCLRDQGLNVDDITFGAGPGGDRGGPPNSSDGSQTGPGNGTGAGNGPGGGFQGGPPPDAAGGNGQGFDPTARIIERLGLDESDPTVKAAVDACSSTLDGAFAGRGQAAGSTTTTEPGT